MEKELQKSQETVRKTYSVEDIENFEFDSDKQFNIDESYELIEFTKKPELTKELAASKEADKIIENTSKLYLGDKYTTKIKSSYQNLRNLMKRYDINSDLVKNMNEESANKIYGIAQYLFDFFQKDLKIMTFEFNLTKDEKKFLLDIFRNKLEYDQNEIFQVKELKNNYLDELSNNNVSYIKVDDIIILYHLISKYKVKGINSYYYSYVDILTKIGERIKLFNAYNVWIERLSSDFQLWGGSLPFDSDINDKPLNNENVESK